MGTSGTLAPAGVNDDNANNDTFNKSSVNILLSRIMKLVRVIEEFSNENQTLHKEYILNINPEKILEVLDDFVLNEDDNPNEIYDPYNLTIEQIEKLKPFLNEELKENLEIYSYQLGCYKE